MYITGCTKEKINAKFLPKSVFSGRLLLLTSLAERVQFLDSAPAVVTGLKKAHALISIYYANNFLIINFVLHENIID